MSQGTSENSKKPKEQENFCDLVLFASDWLKGWRVFSKSIRKRGEVKPLHSQVSSALKVVYLC